MTSKKFEKQIISDAQVENAIKEIEAMALIVKCLRPLSPRKRYVALCKAFNKFADNTFPRPAGVRR